ncbi:hypothetical protein AM2_023 [Lactococcus phage AM2]|uniref:Uncharacterized protein n=8 Tax=Audreyjarvisvirus TaxID=2843351 RepID=A0A1W6JLH8_9CAUD|nr:hypothetical protein H1Z30_gp023 [Lactococcus phage AM1]YP_009905173.1 hypothetical protein H1Z34_gp026 [Lactococcus phage LW81]ARM66328.1 hypothetical protein AM2_023 [Lactococcus phage AM2]ARM66505.1 hypothetical protein AM3_023 [Lactococcus phage AM3]ARM67058.1 hypothetical protein AM8_023 [Lactococcus phage AM8]ARM67236.1 hypothetical protein AM9_023 [Lactococcus phage AM9]ARM67415.1 hypothetical protein AM11_023 [Lactococcus phage AM11]ARQ95603.1 hypothetical protein AM12_024 [Lactoc
MKEYKVKEVINRLQDEAGYSTGGYVDRLVFSGLDVHEMLNEIEQAIIEDIYSVEKLQEQLNTAKKALIKIDEIINDEIHECNYYICDDYCELYGWLDNYSVDDIARVIKATLAEVGGDDE